MDYTLSHPTPLALFDEPVPVTVTLLTDGVTGEVPETILLTLVQDVINSPSDNNEILVTDTVKITVQDNDCMTV